MQTPLVVCHKPFHKVAPSSTMAMAQFWTAMQMKGSEMQYLQRSLESRAATISALQRDVNLLHRQKSELARHLDKANGHLDFAQPLLEKSWDDQQVCDQR